MDYSKLVAVTGLSGLFELVSSKADGGIVKSLQDGSSKFVSNRIHQFSHLESIEIYTTDDNVNMVEVLQAMNESKEKLPDAKADNKAIKAYFEKVFPSIDFDRVYTSDMKKMIKWFEILNDKKIEIKVRENAEAADEEEAAAKPEKKATAKQVAPKAAPVKNAPAKKINTPRKMA